MAKKGRRVGRTRVHVDEATEVIDGRVDDDPEIVLLVVLRQEKKPIVRGGFARETALDVALAS